MTNFEGIVVALFLIVLAGAVCHLFDRLDRMEGDDF
jgi:hypothetical protein